MKRSTFIALVVGALGGLGVQVATAQPVDPLNPRVRTLRATSSVTAPTGNFSYLDAGTALVNGPLRVLGNSILVGTTLQVGTTTLDSIQGGGESGSTNLTFASSVASISSGNAMTNLYPRGAVDVTDLLLNVLDGTPTTQFKVFANGAFGRPVSDQSADCDNAATGNAPVGKICIQAGQGSMTLTNSLVTTSSLVHLTNVSDDATCLSGYATVGTGSVVIGCVGAGTATANTVFAFQVTN